MTNDTRFVEGSFDTGEVVITYAESKGSGTPLLLLHGVTLDWHSVEDFLLPTLTESWPSMRAICAVTADQAGRVPATASATSPATFPRS